MTLAQALRASNLGIAYAPDTDLDIWVTIEDAGFSVTVRAKTWVAGPHTSSRSIHEPRLYPSLLDLFAARPRFQTFADWQPLILATPTTR